MLGMVGLLLRCLTSLVKSRRRLEAENLVLRHQVNILRRRSSGRLRLLPWLAAQPPNLEEIRNAFDRIIKAGNQTGQVIGRIRALIQKAPTRHDLVDINETILEVITLTRSEIQRNGVSLRTQLAKGLPLIQGDRIQLQQVILNFFVNAIEALSGVSEESRELLISSEEAGSDG